ncbi:MAG TPA: carboxypeptidase regulatory-like domain-containing protein, partial [Gemmatimonadaceae bacterium]|nr:carboxypeptidase regulatory-like domain-containing protein [Gemmatimonadaceae bacterium]
MSLSLAATISGAQTIRGVVIDQADKPVAGVVMQLLDSTSNVAGRSLSNERGEFRLASTRAGTYRVRTMRIGYLPTISEPAALLAGGEITQRVTLTGVRFVLDTMHIVSDNVCPGSPASGAATYAVWEQVRTALSAVQLTGAGRNIAATTVGYERSLGPDGRRVLQQKTTVRSEYATQPWLTISPDSLRRGGYVITDRDNSTIYYGPGLDALLANTFIEDHCFRLINDRKDKTRIGVAFEPSPARKKTAEVRGTLWLDRASSELRRMEYGYANIPSEQEQEARGETEFARMTNGTWAISRWNIRMPVLEQRIRSTQLGGSGLHVAEIRESGGELALARRGSDTLWSRPPIVVTGSVRDSTSGNAVAAARLALAGTGLTGMSDDRGRFTIAGVLPGEYTLEVHTPSLDSVSAMHQTPLIVTNAATPFDVRVPNGSQIGAMLCGGARVSEPGIVLGAVGIRGDSIPPRNIVVSAEWQDVALHGEDGGVSVDRPLRRTETRTDARGVFRVCGVPLDKPVLLRATTAGANAAPVSVRIPANGRFARAELSLDRAAPGVALFTGFVLADSTHQPVGGAEVTLPELSQTTLTDDKGAFRFSEVVAGTHRVVVRRVGFGPLDTPVGFAAGQTVHRQILLSRVTMLDSVVVVAGSSDPFMRDFEENKKLGLGHFFTRAELARMEGASTGSLLSQVPGMDMKRGMRTQSWPSTTRIRTQCKTSPSNGQPDSKCLAQEEIYYLPEAFERAQQGMKAACYAQVYFDRILMNRGRPTPPFDLST